MYPIISISTLSLVVFCINRPVSEWSLAQRLCGAAPVALYEACPEVSVLGLCRMASPFKIPKKKQAEGSDSLHMQSPLSRLQSAAPQLKVGFPNTASPVSPFKVLLLSCKHL